MDSPNSPDPTPAPAAGHRHTSGTEVDPTQGRYAESEHQTIMGEAHSDKSRQSVVGYPLASPSGTAEKEADDLDHVSDHNPTPRNNSIDSIAASSTFSHPTRTNTDCSQHSVASTTATLFSAIAEDDEALSLDSQAFDDVLASAPFTRAFAKGVGIGARTILGRAYTVESPPPSRSSSMTQDPDHGGPVKFYNPLVSRSGGPSQRALTMPKEKPVHRHMHRGTPPVRQDSLPLGSTGKDRAPPSAQPKGIPLRGTGPSGTLFSRQPRYQHDAGQTSVPLHDQQSRRPRPSPIAAHMAGISSDSVLQTPLSSTPERDMRDWLEKTSSSNPTKIPMHAPEAAVLDKTFGSEATTGSLKHPILPVAPGSGFRRKPSRLSDNPDSAESQGGIVTPIESTPRPQLSIEVPKGATGQEAGDLMDTDSGGAITPEESISGLDENRPTDDVCDLLLQHVFGLRLRDLARPQGAWEAINYCLAELSHIVDANESLPYQSTMPIRQRAGNSAAGPSGYGQGNGSPNGNGEAPQGGPSRRKRGRKQDNPEGNDPDDGEGSGDGIGRTGSKKLKLHLPTLFSCPYRKRNPLRFNVRAYQSCATQGFADMTLLKRHVKSFHGRKTTSHFVCQRCKASFSSAEALEAHAKLPGDKICEPSDVAPEDPSIYDPEDGITPQVQEMLNERKLHGKIDRWEPLWRTLFPGDQNPLDHQFVPAVEWDEVKAEFEESSQQLGLMMRDSIREMQLGLDPTLIDVVAIKAAQVSGKYISTAMINSKRRVDGYVPSRRRRNRLSSISSLSDESSFLVVPLSQDFVPPTPQLGGGSASNEGSSVLDEPPESHTTTAVEPLPAEYCFHLGGAYQFNDGALAAPAPLPQRPMDDLQSGADKARELAQPHSGPVYGGGPGLHSMAGFSNEELAQNYPDPNMMFFRLSSSFSGGGNGVDGYQDGLN